MDLFLFVASLCGMFGVFIAGTEFERTGQVGHVFMGVGCAIPAVFQLMEVLV